MIKFATRKFCLPLFLLAFFQFAGAESALAKNRLDKTTSQKSSASDDDKEKNAVAETTRIVAEIVENSYPELQNARIKIKTFHAAADYFRSRFSVARFLTFRQPRYLIFVNPKILELNAPEEAVRAILAHVAYYERQNRFELFGLLALTSKSFVARFERGADLQAIKRGYGAGLKQYRECFTKTFPPETSPPKNAIIFRPPKLI